jgi:hypothetical protein
LPNGKQQRGTTEEIPPKMTQQELIEFIEANYGKGAWLMFVADINAIRETKNLEPLSVGAVSNWLHKTDRNPPSWLAEYLPLIKARLANPEAAIIYQIPLALSREESKILIRTAKQAHSTPEEFLRICARLGFEDQCGIEDD